MKGRWFSYYPHHGPNQSYVQLGKICFQSGSNSLIPDVREERYDMSSVNGNNVGGDNGAAGHKDQSDWQKAQPRPTQCHPEAQAKHTHLPRKQKTHYPYPVLPQFVCLRL